MRRPRSAASARRAAVTLALALALATATALAAAPARAGAGADGDSGGDGATARLERTAAAAARARVAAPDRFEVEAVRVYAPELPAAGLAATVREVDGPNRSGMVRVELDLSVDGAPAGDARATVRGRVVGPAVVAARTLPHMQDVRAADLRVEETDLTRLPEPPLRAPGDLGDRVPARTLAEGRPLHPELLAPRPVVRRGEPVDVFYVAGALRVEARGVALHDAAPGETAEARLEPGDARVSGTVGADGTLQVTHRIR